MKHVRAKHPVVKTIVHYALIFVGALLAATALEIFLIPNNIIDGGIVGVSIMASYLTGAPLGLFTLVLNLPFLYIGYKQIGKTFVLSSLFGIAVFSFWLSVFHPVPGLTHDILLAAVFGGIILGVGVGLIIRYGGSLDGTEMIAIVLSKSSVFSVGQVVMFFNVFILSAAGLLFGWDKAMYSLITYFIAFKIIDIVVEGIDESKAAMIVSDHWEEIAEAIMARLGRSVTLFHGEGGYRRERGNVIYAVVTRIEIAKLRAIVMDKDEDAFVTIHNVSDVISKHHQKSAIH